MRKVTLSDGGMVMTERQGRGPTILLVSGLGGTAGFWKPWIAARSTQWDMISFDQRAIGQSTRGEAAVTIAQLAEDCCAILDAYDVKDCVIIGHSTGGVIAQYLAANHPQRIKAAILSGSWLKADAYIHALFQQRKAILYSNPEAYQVFGAMMGYAPDWLHQNWQVFEAALATTPRTERAQHVIAERIDALLAFDGTALAPLITQPVLILGAKDDAIIPCSHQQHLQSVLPHARFRQLDSGGHFFPLTRLEDTLHSVDAFMDSYDG